MTIAITALACPRCAGHVFATEAHKATSCNKCGARLMTRYAPRRGMFLTLSDLDPAHITPDHIDDVELDAREIMPGLGADIASATAHAARLADAPSEVMTKIVALYTTFARCYPDSRCAVRGLPDHTARGAF